MRNICIGVPVLNSEYTVYVMLGDKKWACKSLKKWIEDDTIVIESFERIRGRCVTREGYLPHIYIALKPTDPHFWSTVSHEAVHAINFIWKVIGETSKDEVYAHSVGAIVFAVGQLLKNEKKKK